MFVNMGPKKVFLLTVSFLLYILLGAISFMYLEKKPHIILTEVDGDHIRDIAEMMSDELKPLADVLTAICEQQGKEHSKESKNISDRKPSCLLPKVTVSFTKYETRLLFLDCLELAVTTVTTIGYGHISPASMEGRIFTIIYAVLGIPFCGLILAIYADSISRNLIKLYNKILRKCFQCRSEEESRKWICISICIYLTIGFLVFVFGPAAIFAYIENWSYVDSVYYAVVSVSTIGFGDLVPASHAPFAWHYRLFICIWVIIGLSYWITLLNFVTKLMRSKKIKKAINRRAADLRDSIQKQIGKGNGNAFVSQYSKGTLNFMMGMSMALSGKDKYLETENQYKVSAIPGIASLFSKTNMETFERLVEIPALLEDKVAQETDGCIQFDGSNDAGSLVDDEGNALSSVIIVIPQGVKAVGGDFFPFCNSGLEPAESDEKT